MRCLWGVQWRHFSRLAPSKLPPLWWQEGWPRKRAGSLAEAELLAPLGELLMPGTPVGELFRSFKSPPGWGGHCLEPDLTTYGVLKDEAAALFVEYDGYWRHAEKEGMVRDQLKNLTLLAFAPSGSLVVRISHKSGSKLDGHVLCIGADAWRQGDRKSLATTLKALLKQMLPRLEHVLHTDVKSHLQKQVRKEQMVISRSAQQFCEEAVIRGRGSTPKEISVFFTFYQLVLWVSRGLLSKNVRPEDIQDSFLAGRCSDRNMGYILYTCRWF